MYYNGDFDEGLVAPQQTNQCLDHVRSLWLMGKSSLLIPGDSGSLSVG